MVNRFYYVDTCDIQHSRMVGSKLPNEGDMSKWYKESHAKS